MKVELQYLNDARGNIKAVQLTLQQWNKLLDQLKKYEHLLKIKSDLTEAFSEVQQMQKGKLKKQSLSGFLNEF
jgi:hypothetical protein